MKKIILSLVLAASAFNGWLSASGSASLSTSELLVDDVEMVAEGETAVIIGPGKLAWKVVKWAAEVAGIIDLGVTVYQAATAEDYQPYWKLISESYDCQTGHGHKSYKCVEGSNPATGANDRCSIGATREIHF